MELEAGQIIEGLRGRFQIKRRCGEGGFGLTFEGVDAQGRPVAIKQLRFERLRDWKALELFEREGQVLAQLSHPCIPAYVDFFVHDGKGPRPPASAAGAQGGALSWFLVQQFVQGPTLQQLVAGQQRPGGERLTAILHSLLSTLDYLHTLRPPVIHRDINPKNIVLAPDGRPFLVDFGAIQDRLRFEDKQGSTSVGTLGYMPLEQLRGAARPSSDLYALGMTMLALASGVSPSEMPVDEDTGKVSIARVAPGLSPAVRSVLDRMIEPIAGQRLGSAAEALALLDQPAHDPPAAPPPAQHRTAGPDVRVLLGGAAGVLVVGAGVAAMTLLTRGKAPPPRPVVTTSVATATAVRVTTTPEGGRPGQQLKRPDGTLATPPQPFLLTWKARVASSTGKPLAAGAACEIKATGNAVGNQLTQQAVVARCGSETLYDSNAQLNGTSSTSWRVDESAVVGKAGVFSYRLQYSDLGSRVGERAQGSVDTLHRQAVFFSETVPLYRVTLTLDPESANRSGDPLLPLNRQPFSKVIERKGKVIEASGKSPAPVGAPCQLVISPGQASGHTCRATLTCNGRRLYGAKPTNGHATCTLENDDLTGFVDNGSDDPEDDPDTRVDLTEGTVSVSEGRGEAYALKIKLSP